MANGHNHRRPAILALLLIAVFAAGCTQQAARGPATSPTASWTANAGSEGSIGHWQDVDGQCPAGSTRVDLTSVAQIRSASRGEPPLRSGRPGNLLLPPQRTYQDASALLYITHGGAAGRPVVFVGQSREGVVLRGHEHAITPFFTALDNWVNLNLVETRTFPDGVLLTRYETRR
jgi:hypothetical protein